MIAYAEGDPGIDMVDDMIEDAAGGGDGVVDAIDDMVGDVGDIDNNFKVNKGSSYFILRCANKVL